MTAIIGVLGGVRASIFAALLVVALVTMSIQTGRLKICQVKLSKTEAVAISLRDTLDKNEAALKAQNAAVDEWIKTATAAEARAAKLAAQFKRESARRQAEITELRAKLDAPTPEGKGCTDAFAEITSTLR